jgi:transcriptional regulator with XRE-family HTH domain
MKKLEVLKLAIFRSGISQVKIGMAAGIGEVRLSQIVHGKVEPTAEEKRSLSKILGVDQAKLFPSEEAEKSSLRKRRAA